MYKLGLCCKAPVVVKVKVNRQDLPMEVDTGALVSVMSHHVMKSILDENWPLRPSQAQLRTYSGEIIKPLGIVDVEVSYQGQRKMLLFVIIPSDGPTLLGCNWLKEVQLDWKSLFHHRNIHQVSVDSNLEEILKAEKRYLEQN